MKRKFFIANWKMYLNGRESLVLAKDLKARVKKFQGKVIICPSFTILEKISRVLDSTKIEIGAQNIFWQSRGAFTGEISPQDLKKMGCRYAIIGHSERRIYLKETDEIVNLKMKAALSESLIPILCVGETAKEKKNKRGVLVVIGQMKNALKGFKIGNKEKIIIAYEPIWAIGTGRSATPEDAESMGLAIRNVLVKLYSAERAKNNFSILYGGSVDSSTVKSFVSQKNIDGVLVGGASTKAGEFVKMIKALG